MIRHDTFLRSFDPMVQEVVGKHYEEGLGMKIHRRSKQTKIEKHESTGKLKVHYEDSNGTGVLEDVDTLIWAIGRKPKTRDLALDGVEIETNGRGHVAADDFQNTNAPNIFSLGDVSGKVELTPGIYHPSLPPSLPHNTC